ncbi:MAG: protein BatD [Bacteroidetes bacterium]|nr:protein BatD [Bacteroidota bacterium]
MYIKRNIWAILLLLTVTMVYGQDETYRATAPAIVRSGEQFQYVIEGSKQGDITLPAMDGFQLLAGPFSSFSSHSQWVNGKHTMETVVTYTHILRANRTGTFTISAASIRAGRKEYKTNAVKITVNGGGTQQNSQGGTSAGAEGGQEGAKVQSNGSNPVFLRVMPSKKEVYVGEQFVSALRVYTRINTRPASGTKDLPYEGFYKKSLDPDAKATRQNINGEQYVTQVIQRHILIPQKSGKIVIEPYESEWMVQQRIQRRSNNNVFDSFFDDPFFGGVQEIPTKLSTPSVSINVKPLPRGAPAGFTGGVGSFTIKAELSAEELEVNEALSLKITIRGAGNLPLMGEPEVNLPPDHDLYDVSRSLNTSVSENRISGSVTFEYPIVARHAGRFRIAPTQFSWFDPASGEYRSSSTSEFNFTVLKGETESGTGTVFVPGIMQESVEDLGTDIRDISRAVPELTPVAYSLMGQRWYKLLYLATLALAILAVLYIRTVTLRNADLRLVRNRQAKRSARNRFKSADKFRKSGDEDRFYEEIGKAIWGYLADKLGIETSGLSREAVSAELASREVAQDLLEEFTRILEESEFSRFAPSSAKSGTEQLYRDALQLIRNLENRL